MERKVAGKHDFAGSCAPTYEGQPRWNDTFSLGVFEWVKTNDGRSTKRGKVKVRVHGGAGYANRVTEKAREIVAALDAGTYSGPKNVRV